MSNLKVNTINDASGGSNAVLYGVAAPANSMGFRNRLMNANMAIAQRATSATVTAGTAVPTASTGYPAVDRFFVYSTGANVTAARVAGAGNTQYRMQITGAASVTAVGVGQRIEQLNSYDLAGVNATLSVDLANSLLTTVTWTASYATTADTFGTIGTPTKTQIATGTFTVNSTVTNYTAPIAIPAAATTGIEILLTVGAQTSGTWTIGNIQLEAGSVASPFERRDYGRELIMCQRYYRTSYIGVVPGTISSDGVAYGGHYYNTSSPANGIGAIIVNYGTDMRAAPTVNIYSPNNGAANFVFDNANRAASVAGNSLRSLYVTYSGNGGVIGTVQYTSSAEL
jgi:hypothetical protein